MWCTTVLKPIQNRTLSFHPWTLSSIEERTVPQILAQLFALKATAIRLSLPNTSRRIKKTVCWRELTLKHKTTLRRHQRRQKRIRWPKNLNELSFGLVLLLPQMLLLPSFHGIGQKRKLGHIGMKTGVQKNGLGEKVKYEMVKYTKGHY